LLICANGNSRSNDKFVGKIEPNVDPDEVAKTYMPFGLEFINVCDRFPCSE